MIELPAPAASSDPLARSSIGRGAVLLTLACHVVSAYVGANRIAPEAVPALIRTVHRALSTIDTPVLAPVPVVPVERSVFPDFLICLEDGRRLKMLKGHLRAKYGMTPDEYRAKWGLGPNYPMVAVAYSRVRSEMARAAVAAPRPA